MNLRIFRKKPSRKDVWKQRIEAFFVGTAIILFWRGIWHLADLYLFGYNITLSAIASLLIGTGILVLTRNFANQFLDEVADEKSEYK